jgi:uncharacterized membrane protein
MTLFDATRLFFGAFFVVAGARHFTHERFYLKMMPPFVPAHRPMVWASGVAEILLGVGLCFQQTRVAAAWGLVALLIAVFPANVYMLQVGPERFPKIPRWTLVVRLPLQGVFIAWAWLYTRA